MTELNPGNRIRELRKKAAMTAKDLADQLDTTESTISRIESGKQNLTQAWLLKIARALGVKVTELLESVGSEGAETNCVTVCGRIAADKWTENVFFEETAKYDIPLVGLKSSDVFKLLAFEYVDANQGWVICCELPRILIDEYIGKEFGVCRIDKYKQYELSLKRLEQGLHSRYLVSDKGEPSNRIVRLDDDSICTLWRVMMRYEAYYQAPFAK